MITRAQLLAIMPNAASAAPQYLRPLGEAMGRYAIDRPARQAAFLAQLAHESGELRRVQENLNYSWEGLRKVFPRHFRSDAEAQAYDRQPERIANRVYANRMLNGDEASGDGWRFRGRGPIQVTGRENYRKAGQALGFGLESDPDRMLDPATGCLAAAWFWHSRGLNTLADADSENGFREITRRINGGFLGLEERIHYWERARQVLGLPDFGPVMAQRMGAVRMPPGTRPVYAPVEEPAPAPQAPAPAPRPGSSAKPKAKAKPRKKPGVKPKLKAKPKPKPKPKRGAAPPAKRRAAARPAAAARRAAPKRKAVARRGQPRPRR
jgi:putative chitinase